ncbi:MAG: HPr family phosphocarrier protein [Deltaproteobacteria bacterium]|nr:HPr family phosphocarrier protein [Deltaproteobacteria bacterium]
MTTEQKIVSENEFTGILEPFAQPLLSLSHHAGALAEKENAKHLHMGFLANVIKYASDAEHLLDRYRARHNLNWVYFRELTASAKNFGKASFLLEELKKDFKGDSDVIDEKDDFIQRAESVSFFLNDVIINIFVELQHEAQRLGMSIPEEKPLSMYGVKHEKEVILPHTIEESADTESAITAQRILHRCVAFGQKAEFLERVIQSKPQGLVSQIPSHINEGKLRRLGTRLHNLVSWYDSYVVNHSIEREFTELEKMRESFSVLLNLSKIGTILAHYFERHLMLPSPVVKKLKKLVPVQRLLEDALFFTIYYQVKCFHAAREYADAVLNSILEEVTYDLPVPRNLGFHARPSTLVAKVVQQYGAHVKMLVDDQSFDAGSILELLSAGGYVVTKGLDHVRFRGDKRTLDDLKILAEYNYGETEKGRDAPLPEALSYLK